MEQRNMNLYIIAGCNGAGKTTASFTMLPEMLKCREFVNADEIAAGLSPFNPEGVAIQAGRLMIDRIIHLLKEGESFAFEKVDLVEWLFICYLWIRNSIISHMYMCTMEIGRASWRERV